MNFDLNVVGVAMLYCNGKHLAMIQNQLAAQIHGHWDGTGVAYLQQYELHMDIPVPFVHVALCWVTMATYTYIISLVHGLWDVRIGACHAQYTCKHPHVLFTLWHEQYFVVFGPSLYIGWLLYTGYYCYLGYLLLLTEDYNQLDNNIESLAFNKDNSNTNASAKHDPFIHAHRGQR